jgi:hypothetical protein
MIRFQFRSFRCQSCGARLDKGVPFLRRVPSSLLLMHSLCDAIPRDVLDPQDEGWREGYWEANIAMVTEALQAFEEGGVWTPAYLAAVRRVIEEVPHRTQVTLSGLITALVVDELAKAQGRTTQEVWSEIALRAALAFPEDAS